MADKEFQIGNWNCETTNEDSQLSCSKEGSFGDTVTVEADGDASMFTSDKELKFQPIMEGSEVELEGEREL